jgi:WD40 repeat protein
MNEVT